MATVKANYPEPKKAPVSASRADIRRAVREVISERLGLPPKGTRRRKDAGDPGRKASNRS